MSTRDERRNRREQARSAMAKREAMQRPKFQTLVGTDSWRDVLHELDGLVMDRLRRSADRLSRYGSVFPAAMTLLKTGSMLRPPASEQELSDVEGRFQISLPPSYRAFLEVSNGMSLPVDGQFLRTSDIQSYTDIDPIGSDLMEEFAEDFEEYGSEPSDEQYFQYSSADTTRLIRPRYASTALALNGPLGGNSHVGKGMGWALLVREVKFATGEYEIWQQAFEWQARFPSFASYFSSIRSSLCESADCL